MTSNREHDDSVVRIFTFFVGKAVKVARKIASQVHCKGGCSNSTNLQEVLRFMSYRFYVVGMIALKRRNKESDGLIIFVKAKRAK